MEKKRILLILARIVKNLNPKQISSAIGVSLRQYSKYESSTLYKIPNNRKEQLSKFLDMNVDLIDAEEGTIRIQGDVLESYIEENRQLNEEARKIIENQLQIIHQQEQIIMNYSSQVTNLLKMIEDLKKSNRS